MAEIATGNMAACGFGVTIGADPDYLRVVHRTGGNWNPGRRIFLMTGIAYRARGNMVYAATTGDGAVMTGKTITTEWCVIGHGGTGNIKPIGGVMASVTLSRGDDMIRSLATCLHTVMTTGTSANGLSMIDRAGGHGLPICTWRHTVTGDAFVG